MRYLILSLLLAFTTVVGAQNDAKYLSGAVVEENGKVVFNREIDAPTYSDSQIFDRAESWLKNFYTKDRGTIVYSNKEKGDLATVGKQYLVFQDNAISLDRSIINYRLLIRIKNHKCILKFSSINYAYEVSNKREPEKYAAEDWITDKYALHNNKINRGNGKFRTKTIDLVDEIAQGIANTLSTVQTPSTVPAQIVAPAENAAAKVSESPNAPKKDKAKLNKKATKTEPAKVESSAKIEPAAVVEPAAKTVASAREGYTPLEGGKVPNTLQQMIPGSKMQVNADNVKEMNARWHGIDSMFGKQVAAFEVDTNSKIYKTIGNGDTFDLFFFKEGETADKAWLIIECKKQGETENGNNKIVIGEILHSWIK